MWACCNDTLKYMDLKVLCEPPTPSNPAEMTLQQGIAESALYTAPAATRLESRTVNEPSRDFEMVIVEARSRRVLDVLCQPWPYIHSLHS